MQDVESTRTTRPAADLRHSLLLLYVRLTRPSTMPLRRQLLIGLAAYAVLLVLLVAFGINGSSMGLLYAEMFGTRDPAILRGTPRAIRSDEWLVVSPLTVAQVQEGLPRTSGLFPGGFDTSIVWDLPYREWSVLLRPHMWGFFFLPLDNAYAMKWWLPFLTMAAAVFVLLCTLWRRPLASFAVAGAFAAAPFFQWWFGSGSFWPPAAAVAACAGTVLMLRTDRTWVRWVVAAVVSYLVVVAVVALYPPYLIPCLYPAVGFVAGWLLVARGLPWRDRLRRVAPLAVGAVVAGLVLVAFLLTRRDTIDAVVSTVYPGQRLTPTGSSSTFSALAMFAGVFGIGLRAADTTGFAANQSEGSSFIFFGLYLVPSALWLVWSRWRRGRGVDWAIVGVLASLALLFAFVYVPGWDAIAHLLLLDRVVGPRIVIGMGVGSILLLALVVARLRDLEDVRIPVWTTAASVATVLVWHWAVHVGLTRNAPQVLEASIAWGVLLAMLTVAIGMFSRGRATVPGVLVALVALVVAGWVNPIYRGVFDMRATDVGRAIEEVDSEDPGSWVSVGGPAGTAVLRETGVEAYSGVQGWPSLPMWDDLDPEGDDEQSWNRYAHVNWTADPAAPEIVLVTADVVQVRLDSCGPIAQENIEHVLSQQPIDQPCLREVESVPEGGSTFHIYEVVPKP
ncbi:hypothetical protein [Cellulomonas sp.]|uniref:DUF7657 domain-containing protein n=1 Tax=Cellulomonas sp. TaxID=40001 RepID=UPI001B213F25|nr:hypothetical protein [Cellulomonas sp.]MBO9555491.1 hypothetical protein [Cellulomonas sp.]